MTRLTGILCMAAIAGLNLAGICGEYPLAINGKSNTLIQHSATPGGPELRAANELQGYLKKITGADVQRIVNPTIFFRLNRGYPDCTEILLVTLEHGKRLMPPEMYGKLANADDEAFYLKTDGRRIVIGGKKPIGVLYGVYTFLEKYLGVRWFHPGPDGEYCPKDADLKVGEIDDFQEPSIPGRMISCWAKSVTPWTMDEVRDWQARNKIQYAFSVTPNPPAATLETFQCGDKPLSGGGGHMTFENAVPKYMFEKHPEYFPLVNGKRVCEERSQRCLANPEVRKLVTDYALEILKYDTDYMISFNDATFSRGSWCQCPECLEMGTYNGKFQLSNLAHRFTSEIADDILKINPDARLSVEIYSEFRDLPTDPSIRYDKRVLGRYCPHQRCYVHNFDDPKCDYNAKLYPLFLDWQKICPRIELFDFYAYARSPYAPMEYTLAHDLKLYKKHNLTQWFDDCTNKDLPILSSNWPFYYVAAKMGWDTAPDVEQLLDEAYGIYYGAASAPMKKYQAYRRELWESAPGHALYGGPTRIAYCLTVPGAEKRLKGYLDEAEKLAGGDAVLKRRIAADRERLETFWVKEAETLRQIMAGQNNIPVQEVSGEIVIDGKLDEEDWRKAQLVTGFLTTAENNKPGAPVEETRVKVLYDKDNWYIGIEAMSEHAWSPLKTDVRKRDGEVWTDDSVEIFIVPPGGADYYQWVVNSAGVFYDARLRSAEFDSGAEIKSTVSEDRYVIEARIPVTAMQAKIIDGQVWKMHFGRTCRNLQPPQTVEESALDGIPAPDPIPFRRAAIGKNILRNGNFEEIKADAKTGRRFPFRWGGNNATLIEGEHNRNQIKVENGYIASYVGIPKSEQGLVLSGSITAAGDGELNIRLDSCIRPPGDQRPTKNEIQRKIPPVKLNSTMTSYPFEFKLKPHEDGSLFINTGPGTVFIEGVTLVAKEAT